MYSFIVLKNGKQTPTIHTEHTDDKAIAYAVWEKMQLHYEKRWSMFGYSYSIYMLSDGQEMHHIDYEY